MLRTLFGDLRAALILLPCDGADVWLWQDLIGDSLVASSETWNNTWTICVLYVELALFAEMKVLAVFHLTLQSPWLSNESFGSDKSSEKGTVHC